MASATITATNGSFTLTGQVISWGFIIAAEPGMFSLDGQEAGLRINTMFCKAGSFLLRGQSPFLDHELHGSPYLTLH